MTSQSANLITFSSHPPSIYSLYSFYVCSTIDTTVFLKHSTPQSLVVYMHLVFLLRTWVRIPGLPLNFFSNLFSESCTSYSLMLLFYKFQFLAFFSMFLSLDSSLILIALSITSMIGPSPTMYMLLTSLLAAHCTPSCEHPMVTSQLACPNEFSSFF